MPSALSTSCTRSTAGLWLGHPSKYRTSIFIFQIPSPARLTSCRPGWPPGLWPPSHDAPLNQKRECHTGQYDSPQNRLVDIPESRLNGDGYDRRKCEQRSGQATVQCPIAAEVHETGCPERDQDHCVSISLKPRPEAGKEQAGCVEEKKHHGP